MLSLPDPAEIMKNHRSLSVGSVSHSQRLAIATSSTHRHPAGEQCSGHRGKVNRRHRHPGAVRDQPGEFAPLYSTS